MKILVINNIKSGLGDGSVYDFIRSFVQENDEILIQNTVHSDTVNKLLKNAKDFDIVVVSGGDKTISQVSYSLAYSGIPILPYPSGTFNIIAMNLFLPSEAHALAKVAKECKTLDFDIGLLEINGQKFPFGANAGIGYGTKISKEADPTIKNLGPLAIIGAALSNIKPQYSTFHIKLDNKVITEHGIGILLMNFAKIGLELPVTHKNRPRDGKLDIVVLKAKTALNYIPAITAAALDNAINFPDRSKAIKIYQANEVEISANPNMEIQADGGYINLQTPLKAKILPLATKYVVSQDCLEKYNN